MNHEWVEKAMSRRQASYGHGGRDRMVASFWGALKGSLESQLAHYKRANPGSRIELEASKDKMVVVGTGATITLKPDQMIEVSGPTGAETVHAFLPLTPQAVDRLAQKILEPALFPDQLVTVDFREAVEAKRA